jgi:hypothetical protein
MSAQPNVISITPAALGVVTSGINLRDIRAALPELEAACRAKIEVAEAFGDLCKIIAAKAGVSPQVLASYITAVCNDTLAKREAQLKQLTLLFEELT